MYVVLDRQQRQKATRQATCDMQSEYAGDPTGNDLIHTVEVLDIHDRRDEDARYPRVVEKIGESPPQYGFVERFPVMQHPPHDSAELLDESNPGSARTSAVSISS